MYTLPCSKIFMFDAGVVRVCRAKVLVLHGINNILCSYFVRTDVDAFRLKWFPVT